MLVATIETWLWVREDSQIDFATGNIFLHVGGGGGRGFTQEHFSNFSKFFCLKKSIHYNFIPPQVLT